MSRLKLGLIQSMISNPTAGSAPISILSYLLTEDYVSGDTRAFRLLTEGGDPITAEGNNGK
jgi:hypothetical protein